MGKNSCLTMANKILQSLMIGMKTFEGGGLHPYILLANLSMTKGVVISTLHANFKTPFLAKRVTFSFNEGCSRVSAKTIKKLLQGVLEQYYIQRTIELVS